MEKVREKSIKRRPINLVSIIHSKKAFQLPLHGQINSILSSRPFCFIFMSPTYVRFPNNKTVQVEKTLFYVVSSPQNEIVIHDQL